MDDALFASRVVVGTDGSADANAAVAAAAALAAQLGAEVILVHAVMLLEHLEGHEVEPAVAVRDEVEQLLNGAWSQTLRDAGVDHRCVLEDGPPLLVLPRVAAREDAQLIVVASHGAGENRLQQLGSTSHGLVTESPLPVLVVPRRD